MILQALTDLYDDLVEVGKIERPGWSKQKISYILSIDGEGKLLRVIPYLKLPAEGEKGRPEPIPAELPAAVKRSSGVSSNFLWDNSSYLLGMDAKGKPDRTVKCFEACRALHRKILCGVDSENSAAVLHFFDHWDPGDPSAIPEELFEQVISGVNLMFRVDGKYPQDDPKIRKAWQKYSEGSDSKGEMQCLITGEYETPQRIHPAVKGVAGAQSSGAALVSYNSPAFCSYEKEQNLNAPIGKSAAFAYTSALNYLLADKENVHRIGDTTIVCWAEGADPEYEDVFRDVLFDSGKENVHSISNDELYSEIRRLAQGLPTQKLALDPKRKFYVLGLAPNAARISVSFFMRDCFGSLMDHVNRHYERMNIVKPATDAYVMLPIWAVLRETVNLNSKDKSPSPSMADATMRAVLQGTRYPVSLLEAVMVRIHAERNVTRGRAAIIKAYFLKNENPDCPKEVLTVSLNEESRNQAYLLGRLFSIYEEVQQKANPGINTTIKDKYFNSAAASPARIFPVLDNLYQKHLRKLNTGMKIYYDRQVTEIKGRFEEQYPLHLNLPQQGSYNLGYYHQTQKRYTKKEETV